MYLAVSEDLLPATDSGRWSLARELGADGVELLFGPHDFERHELWQTGGPARLKGAVQAAGLLLPSVSAGYFLDHPLTHPDSLHRQRSAGVLDRLLEAAAEAGATQVVLTLLGDAEPKSQEEADRLAAAVTPLAEKMHRQQVTLLLRTVLPATDSLALVSRFAPAPVKLSLDVGLAVALGRDPVAESRLLGEAVGQVRLGDRTVPGLRVPLGQGGVPFPSLAREWSGRSALWGVLDSPARGETRTEAARALAWLRKTLGLPAAPEARTDPGSL